MKTTKRVHYTQDVSDVSLAVVFSGVNENENGEKPHIGCSDMGFQLT